MKYFQVVGKNVRDSGGSLGSGARQSGGGHDSGYGESSSSPPAAMNGAGLGGFRISKSMGMGKGQGAMVYGVVMYDFKAERPDELDAKEGEAIIVIAQSNPEWFVAKPITRLGGPGLIPVSFIEIRDMATGKAAPDPTEAVQRAGVPKVEEWKKMAADYKNGSIPLGTLSSGSGGGMGAVQQSMDRLSLQGQGQNGNGFAGAGQQVGAVSYNSYMARMSPSLTIIIRSFETRTTYLSTEELVVTHSSSNRNRNNSLSTSSRSSISSNTNGATRSNTVRTPTSLINNHISLRPASSFWRQ